MGRQGCNMTPVYFFWGLQQLVAIAIVERWLLIERLKIKLNVSMDCLPEQKKVAIVHVERWPL